MVGNGSFVPGPFLVGFGGMEVGMSLVHLTFFSNLTVPSRYIHAHCRLPCQTSAKNISLNFIATCAIMVQTLCQDDVALYVSPCCADIERNRSKKGGFFLQEAMPCIHVFSLCVYACTRGSCVDSIWFWARKETFSKPVFGVSKTSISGFVDVGPHCYIYIYLRIYEMDTLKTASEKNIMIYDLSKNNMHLFASVAWVLSGWTASPSSKFLNYQVKKRFGRRKLSYTTM